MTVVGVPIGTDENVLERAVKVVKDGGADRLVPRQHAGQVRGGPHRHRIPWKEDKLSQKAS